LASEFQKGAEEKRPNEENETKVKAGLKSTAPSSSTRNPLAVRTTRREEGSAIESGAFQIADEDDEEMRHKFRVKRNAKKSVAIDSALLEPEEISSADFEAEIRVLTLNASIDARYCHGTGCDSMKFGKRSFYIPVSRYMPLFSLDLEMSVPNDWIVKLCQTQLEDLCFGIQQQPEQQSEMETALNKNEAPLQPSKGEGSIWKLPIGQHTRSAYKFRVSKSTTACTEEVNGAGSIFFEYNLFFYRICSA